MNALKDAIYNAKDNKLADINVECMELVLLPKLNQNESNESVASIE